MADIYSRLMDGLAMAKEGAQMKKRRSLADLASQAYGADPDAQRGYVQQAIGLDPQAGFQIGKSLGDDRDQVQAQLAQEASIFAEAPDEQKAAMYPQLAAHAKRLGFPVPDTYDPRMLPMIQKLAASPGSGQEMKSLVRGANGNYWAIRNGQFVDTGTPYAPDVAVRDQPGIPFDLLNKRTGQSIYDQPPPQAPSGPQASAQPGPMLNPTQDFPQLAGNFPGTQVSSLYRDPQHNAEVGGVPNSQHMRGTAGDFVVPKAEQPAFIAKAQSLGYEAIQEGDHIHLELPPGRKAAAAFGAGQQVAQAGRPAMRPAISPAEQQRLDMDRQRLALAQQNSQRVGEAAQAATDAKNMVAEQKANKAAAAAQDTIDNLNDGVSQIDSLLKSPGMKYLGSIEGDALLHIPLVRNAAKDANAQLDVIRNRVVLNTLASLKSLSTNGASGFGALSNQEGEILRNSIASLSNAQTNAQIMDGLRQVQNVMRRSAERIRALQGGQPAAPQSAPQQAGSDFSHLWGGN